MTQAPTELSASDLKDGVNYRVNVKNTGKVLGDDAVLAYMTSSVSLHHSLFSIIPLDQWGASWLVTLYRVL